MTGNSRGNGPGLAGILAAAAVLALGAQLAVAAPKDHTKPAEERKAARDEARKNAPAPKPSANQTQATVTRSVGGVNIGIDPATGKIRPLTPEEQAQLAVALRGMMTRSTEDKEVITLPNGALMVDLQDEFNDVAIATKVSKRQIRINCVNDAKMAEALLNGADLERSVADKKAGKGPNSGEKE